MARKDTAFVKLRSTFIFLAMWLTLPLTLFPNLSLILLTCYEKGNLTKAVTRLVNTSLVFRGSAHNAIITVNSFT